MIKQAQKCTRIMDALRKYMSLTMQDISFLTHVYPHDLEGALEYLVTDGLVASIMEYGEIRYELTHYCGPVRMKMPKTYTLSWLVHGTEGDDGAMLDAQGAISGVMALAQKYHDVVAENTMLKELIERIERILNEEMKDD